MSDSQTIQLPVSPGPTPATPEPSGALATVWAAVLGEQPEPGSNFFASGGTSLGAARLVAGIRRHCEVGLKLVDVLEHPTFGELLALITRSGAAQVAAADTWTLPTGTAPVLSPNQRSRLVRDAGNVRELGRRLPHTVAVTWIADGPLDVPRLFDAARAVGSRHAALSLRVSGPDGVWGGDGAPECRVIDLPGLAVDDDRVRREVDDHAGGLIDLHDGPIWSVQVLRLSAVSHVISIAVDHLVCDGDSLPVLQRDLTEAYETREALPALPHSYFDWVAWQKKLIADSDLDEVRERIGAAPDAGTVVPGLRLRDESQAAGAPAVGVVEQRIPAARGGRAGAALPGIRLPSHARGPARAGGGPRRSALARAARGAGALRQP
ncbi:phosphopantetheine-binding protein [Kitasatospora gansuensis]